MIGLQPTATLQLSIFKQTKQLAHDVHNYTTHCTPCNGIPTLSGAASWCRVSCNGQNK
jgi:hypothetical protein